MRGVPAVILRFKQDVYQPTGQKMTAIRKKLKREHPEFFQAGRISGFMQELTCPPNVYDK